MTAGATAGAGGPLAAAGATAVQGPPVLRPTDLRELRDAVRDTPGTLLARGGGTKQDWGAPPERTDAVVSCGGLDGLVEHSPGDMVAIVQPGLSLGRLQEALAPSGQWLALDPPLVDGGATVGGVVATNDAGPRRQRYGAPRDLVIGVTVVLADGTVARSGGRVVKNVAGFDLMRLYCGSLGTLGVLAEIVVRLHPLPEASRTVRIPADPATATATTLALVASAAVPTAVDLAGGALWIRLQGREAGVAAQCALVRRLAAGGEEPEEFQGSEEAEVWRRLTAAHAGGAGETVARAATLPDRLPAVAAALVEVAARAGVEARLASHAGLGLHTARLSGGDARAHAAVVRDWRRTVAGLGGTVVLRRRIDGVDGLVDPWCDPGAPPSALAVMRRVKAQLDPDRRWAPGRFVGGI